MGRRISLSVAAFALALGVAAGAAVRAQTAKDDSVLNRARPEFDPLGLELDSLMYLAGMLDRKRVAAKNSPFASFLVFPKLDISTSYESNLFRDTSKVSDRIVEISPSLQVRSDWTKHSLEFGVGANIGRHAREAKEDYEDVRLTAGGQIDVSDEFLAKMRASFNREHQQRGAVIDPGPDDGATIFSRSQIDLGAVYNVDRIKIEANMTTVGFDYESGPTLDNDFLDRVRTDFKVHAGYEWLPGTSIFVEPVINIRNYDRDRDASGKLQDSVGWQVLAGLTWDVSGVTFAEFGLGYLRQEFDEPAFPAIQGPSMSGKLIWNPGDPWTVTANVSRAVQETQSVAFSGILATSFSAGVDYELLDNLLLSLGLGFTDENYDNSSRDDNRINASFTAKYLISRNWTAGLSLAYNKLNSNDEGIGFSNFSASVRLGAQM